MFVDDIVYISKKYSTQINIDLRSLLFLGLKDIVIYRINTDSNIELIALNIESQEEYWGDNIFQYSKVLVSPELLRINHYIFSAWQLYNTACGENKILDYLKRFNIKNTLNILEKRNNYLYGYSLRSSRNDLNLVKISGIIINFIHKNNANINFYLNRAKGVLLNQFLGLNFYKSSNIMQIDNGYKYFSKLGFSKEEFKFMVIFIDSYSCKEIASKMNLTERAIQNHIVKLKNKIGLKTIYDLRKYLNEIL